MIRERNMHYTSKGIDRYWDEQYGDGIDHDLFVKECCSKDTPTADDELDNDDNTGNITGTQNEDSSNAKRYIDSLLQRCWDRAVQAASSSLTVPLSDETEEGIGAVKTEEEDDDTPPPNQKVIICSALHQKARDAVDGILDTLMATDSSLRQMLEDPKLKQTVDWCDVLNCLWAETEKQEMRGKEVGALNQSLIKSLSIRLIEQYRMANNGL